MSDFTLFLGKFLRQGTAIASLAPSSRWLARATVSNIDWSRPNVIVELGAGTGPITRVLAESLSRKLEWRPSDVFPPGGGRQTARRSDEGDDRRGVENAPANSRPTPVVPLIRPFGPPSPSRGEGQPSARPPGPHDRLLVVERDPDFAAMLRDRFGGLPHLELIEGDARDLRDMLHDRGIERVDHVVSGLPTPSLPKDVRAELIRVVGDVLKPDGSFNQITEMPWVYRGMYRGLFRDVRFLFEPRNFPPAGVYICRGVKAPVEAT